MLGRLLQTVCVCVFLAKKPKRNIVWEFTKIFETMVGVELLEGYKRAVCDTKRYSNSMQNIFLNCSSPVSDSGLPAAIAKGFLVGRDSRESCVHCN